MKIIVFVGFVNFLSCRGLRSDLRSCMLVFAVLYKEFCEFVSENLEGDS